MAGNLQGEFFSCWLEPQSSTEEWIKQVQHLESHWNRDLFESCLESDLLINSYFKNLKGRWDFCGCDVCYSIIFMLKQQKENAVPEKSRMCCLLIPFCLYHRNETYLSETAYEKIPHTQLILYIALTSDLVKREEKPIWYSATSSKYVFASVKHNTFGDGHISLLNGPDLA